jgi:hypothetical protein
MTLHEHLSFHKESLPEWLASIQPAEEFPMENFLDSRVVFYPGSGTDGFPVKEFGSSYAAHCFVYADYLMDQAKILSDLDNDKRGFSGYRLSARIKIHPSKIIPEDYQTSIRLNELRESNRRGILDRVPLEKPLYAFAEILERMDEHDETGGPKRLCILFIGLDAFAVYEALFYRAGRVRPPYGILIQDHGFGGNYSRFGGSGFMYQTARAARTFPQWLLVAQNSLQWPEYEIVPEVSSAGDRLQRSLYHRAAQPLTNFLP